MYSLVVKLIPVTTDDRIMIDEISTKKHTEECKYLKDILFRSGHKVYEKRPTHKDIMELTQRTLDDIFMDTEDMIIINIKLVEQEEIAITRLAAYVTVRVGADAYTPLKWMGKRLPEINGHGMFKELCEDAITCNDEYDFYGTYKRMKVE